MNSNDKTKTSLSFVTPDSLRKIAQTLKSFIELHTKKNFGREDIEGSQYSGTIENFGSELLLETRKLLMNKPSLRNIFFDNTFDFYFDIQYSNLISTYDQQNILVAVLKKDVLLSNKEYRIRFDNCKDVYILRSESWSDPNVYRDRFVYTSTPPKLIISDKNNPEDIEEISLLVDDGYKTPTNYYYHINPITKGMIDSYNTDDGILITKTLSDDMFGSPFVWMCVDILKTLPDVGFKNNKIDDNNSYLSIGTDGHNITRIYPGVFTPNDISIYHDMYIKATFKNNDPNQSVDKIIIVLNDDLETLENEISFDDSFVKIKLSEEVYWNINDKDDEIFAYISFDKFTQNIPNDNKVRLLSAFIINFDDNFTYPLEISCNDAVSGIHIDASSEYRDNGIYKKNGIIHDLGDFDGLPEYFKYLLDRTIHRSHIELYSLRDSQKSNKQVSALILDSGIPKNEVDDFLKDLDINIKYDISLDPGQYTTEGKIISSSNVISEITFIDENTFGNINIPGQENLSKFIYHGNNLFSLGFIDDLDPMLEFGRIYLLSNDKAIYENNNITDYPKPARTVARICDIPTSFVNLTKIENICPTLIIDKEYVRNGAPYSLTDKDMIWNEKNSRLIMKIDESGNNTLVFSHEDDLDTIADPRSLGKYYMKNLNSQIDISDMSTYSVEIHSGGSDYNVGDTFIHVLCGISIFGTVTNIDLNGVVTDINITSVDDDCVVNINNLSGKTTLCETTSIDGLGNGLILKLIINDDVWESLQPKQGDILSNIYAFKFDEFNNIWIWSYDISERLWKKNVQFTGTEIVENPYDDFNTSKNRSLKNVFIRNILCKNKHKFISPKNMRSFNSYNTISDSDISANVDINTEEDLSSEIIGENKQDCLYILTESKSFKPYHQINAIRKYNHSMDDESYKFELPRFHKINLNTYIDKTNTFEFGFDNDINQPIPFIFNPIKDSIIDYERICGDIYNLNEKHKLTFMDIKSLHEIDLNIFYENGILNRNIYSYNENIINENIESIKESIKTYNHDELIEYIQNNLGINSYPLQFENTDYSFSDEMLRDYIIQNTYDSPIYNKNDLYLFRRKGEKVIEESEDGSIIGIGEQPKGLYVEVSSEIFDSRVNINNKEFKSDMTFIFYIEENVIVESLQGFRIIDELGCDISENSILISGKTKMIFYKNEWKVID